MSCHSVQEQIKSLLTGLMLSTPPLVRAQLSEALSVISSHDFPRKWATLLPELIERLKSGDAATVHVSIPKAVPTLMESASNSLLLHQGPHLAIFLDCRLSSVMSSGLACPCHMCGSSTRHGSTSPSDAALLHHKVSVVRAMCPEPEQAWHDSVHGCRSAVVFRACRLSTALARVRQHPRATAGHR